MLAESILGASSGRFWTAACAGLTIGLYCFYRSFRALHRTRIIEDTPTSKIRSAAQGYTELEGTAELLEGEPIIAPLTGTRCVWYSLLVEERVSDSSGFRAFRFPSGGDFSDFLIWNSGSKGWSTIRREESEAIFRIRDDTGCCLIDPEKAAVTPTNTITWYGRNAFPSAGPRPASFLTRLFCNDRYRYTERRIHHGDPIYVIGMFMTLGADQPEATIETEIRDLLSDWKRDQGSLLSRFDLNRDGRIDPREWEVARKAAAKTVQGSRTTVVSRPSTQIMRDPGDSQLPFILSAVPQKQLIQRQRRWAGLYFVAFLALVFFTAWAVQLRL
ncbi:MAG: GIDE domain-containing protein [Gammaproteobacteria bacterium]